MIKKIFILWVLGLLSACGGDSTTPTTNTSQTPTPNNNNNSSESTAPSTVTATANGTNAITVSWSEVADVSEYEIYRSTNTTTPTTIFATATGTSYANIGLSNNTTYYYWIKTCFTGNNCSDYSNRVSATTAPVPTAPSTITTTVNGTNTITVAWSVVTGASDYEIYRSTGIVAVSSVKIANPLVSAGTSYIDTGLSASTTYYYWVKACNGVCSVYSNSTMAQTPQTATGKLNDTGIVITGNYPSGNNTDCTSTIANKQDCHQGRDAKDLSNTLSKTGAGAAGFDFTKLDSNGNVLAMQNQTWTAGGAGEEPAGTKWSCVKDNVTGLVWEVKTDEGNADANTTDTNHTNIHHKDNRYRWGGLTAIGATHTSTTKGDYYADWTGLVEGTNSERLCGFNNWRVPTIEQLRSIAHLGKATTTPNIDTNYFPNTPANYFWSSNPKAFVIDFAWQLNFNDSNHSYNLRYTSDRVRLVRLGE